MKHLSPGALAALLYSTLAPSLALAQHQHDAHTIEEILVTTSQQRSRSDTALPVSVLSGERLMQNAAATLGETIRGSLGVHSSSFGAGVGQPVIRGLGGNRVTVLQNSLPIVDAAGASQDHASSVEALLAERIEIIRGPASLLYGNGAIGGVVNVINGRIPKTLSETTHGAIELRGRSVDSGRSGVAKLDGSHNDFAWHLDGMLRRSGDYDIPGWAIEDEALGELSSADLDLANRRGYVPNSGTEAKGMTAGASWIRDDGFVGIALSHLKNEYGLPLGTHSHPADDHGHEYHHHAHEVHLDMKQSQIDVEAGQQLENFFNQMDLQFSWTDYEHRELEEHVPSTIFKSEGANARIAIRHGDNHPRSGVMGLQLADRDYSAQGIEAFIPTSDIRSLGLFVLESLDRGSFTHEFGLRLNRQEISTRHCSSRENTWSVSAASLWNYRPDAQLSLSLTRSDRAPAVEELYSNLSENSCSQRHDPHDFVMHGSTARYELGDSRLDLERSVNFELGWRKHLGSVRAEVNLFYNDFADFIYLSDVGEFEGTIVSQYMQDDAVFRGIEAQVMIPVDIGRHHLDFTLFGDFVHATLSKGDYLPRIPPGRAGVEMTYTTHTQWSARLRTTAVARQSRSAAEELPTDSYLRMDAFFDYHIPVTEDGELLLFARVDNLLNEDIRDHSAFIKHYAPAPGRSLELGLRYRF